MTGGRFFLTLGEVPIRLSNNGVEAGVGLLAGLFQHLAFQQDCHERHMTVLTLCFE